MQRNLAIELPHRWDPRDYQSEYLDNQYGGGRWPYKCRSMLVWHRRAGKDSTVINDLAVASHMRIGTYWHLLPTLNQARKVIWNGISKDGTRIINQAFPNELVESINESEMLIRLKNGSFYQLVGSDNYDSLVGSNPIGVAFSEWALAAPAAWNFVRPILVENDGFATFITTPRGRNHAYEMYKMAQKDPKWFVSRKTILDTRRKDGTHVVSPEDVEQERREGVPEELIQQEYYCSFDGVNFGSVYGRNLSKHADNQIRFAETRGFGYDPDQLVFTAWDIGHRDATAVWFYQFAGDEVHIIDYRSELQTDAEWWLDTLSMEYSYSLGVCSLPHDAKAKTFATRYTTQEAFLKAKLQTYIVPNISRSQGINAVRGLIPNIYWDIGNPNVEEGLEAIKMYQYTWDEKLKVFTQEPLHNQYSHPADALRMLALSINVVDRSTRHNRTVGIKHQINTPLGRALNLQTLFEERERELRNNNRRIR